MILNKSHYNKKHKELARNLRKDGTKGEAILWDNVLRGRQFHGYQFNRQFCIDDYIVDFISRKLKLIVEVDGYSHNFKDQEDKLRDEEWKIWNIQPCDLRKERSGMISIM